MRAMLEREQKPARARTLAPTSFFCGRERELDALAEQLETARLVTLLGPGGMGKTSVALAYAESRLAAYDSAGGVWFVDLTGVTTDEGLVAAVASSLGSPRQDSADRVGAYIDRLGPVLLVLDNFEQLVDAGGAAILERWVRTAKSARVLVTSRATLGAPSERIFPLEPLGQEAAATLFVQRALAVDPRASLDPGDVRAIVDAIDRMPLAIELAASRTRVLSLAELRTRLARPLDVLQSSAVSVRQAVLDSLGLLPEPRRRFFALLSALKDGFRVEDAEEILGKSVLPRHEVLDALDGLCRVSLLRSDTSKPSARHGFFVTIREVAEELATSDPLWQDIALSHARHFSRRARELRTSDGLDDGDVENLLTAHATCVRMANGETWASLAVDIARVLERALTVRGRLPRKLHVFDATAGTNTRLPDALRAEILLGRGQARREVGNSQGAREDFEEALRLATTDEAMRAHVLLRLGALDDVVGETERARGRYTEALALLERADLGIERNELVAQAQLLCGHAFRREGTLDEARRLTTAAADHARSVDDSVGLADALYELGVVEMFAGRVEDAFLCFDEGLDVVHRAGLRVMEGAMITARGCLFQDQGDVPKALECHAAAARIFGDCGSRHREGSALYYLATAYVELGEPKQALPLFESARQRLAPIGAARYDALVSSGYSLALALVGRFDDARAELERADAAALLVPKEPALATAVTIRRWCVDAIRGELSENALPDARRLVAEHGSDDTRFALRMLDRSSGPVEERHERPALVVWPRGAAFRLPGANETVFLPERSPLRGILEKLTTARIESPGERVPIEELVSAGWPEERMAAEAALNRVYVALTTLRKKGLKNLIEKAAGGYALTVGVVVEIKAD